MRHEWRVSERRRRVWLLVGALVTWALAGSGGPAAASAGPAPAAAAAVPALLASYPFDEGAGRTAADASGSGHTGTLQGDAGWGPGLVGPGALALHGRGGYVDVPGAVVDTTASFSVAAWVRVDVTRGYQTFVSEDGSQVSAFFLQFRDDTRRFAFTRITADAVAAGTFASSSFTPSAGTWYFLVGVYDSAAQALRLYVNGALQESVRFASPWRAAGDLEIGRGRFAGNLVDFVNGGIDDVRAYGGALSSRDVTTLATSGHWRFDEGAGTATADATGHGHPGTLDGGAGWAAGVDGPHAVSLDGLGQQVTVAGPVLATDQSLSVSAWVRLRSVTGSQTFVSVDGQQAPPFALQLRGDTGRFAFTRTASDASAAGATSASASFTPVAGAWYHLAGVYDRGAGTISLFVDGALQQSVPFTSPWRAAGDLHVGRGQSAGAPADFANGAIDDVQAFQYPLTRDQDMTLAAAGEWSFDEGQGTTAGDGSPNGADGLVQGATWTRGARNGALAFDGRSASVSMGPASSLDFGADGFSLAGWFQTASDATQAIAARSAGREAPGYALGTAGGRVTARIGAGDDAQPVAIATRAGFADGRWHHVALVTDRLAGTVTLFVDGAAQPLVRQAGSCGTVAGAGLDASRCRRATASSPAPFTVGAGSDGRAHFRGALDELRAFHFPLSPDQVGLLANAGTLTVGADQPAVSLNPTQIGVFFEEISHSGDGGFYAELVRNRSLKEDDASPVHWSAVTGGAAQAAASLDFGQPLNAADNRSLKLQVATAAPGDRAGVANDGYWGIPVRAHETYRVSLFAKASAGFDAPLDVSIESADGSHVWAHTRIGGVGTEWRQLDGELTASGSSPASAQNRLVVSVAGPLSGASLWLNQVSLFPPTAGGRANGLRPDLERAIAAIHPGYLRFPGGNYLEGNTIATRFNWKDSIGPTWQRPGHLDDAWGYWSTDGLGLLEYLELCDDLGATPMLGVWAGYTLRGTVVPQAQLQPYVQDALDEIQYATGSTSTPWGAQRARDGHPKPFSVPYVEVGNEDFFDRSGSYNAYRYPMFHDAIKAAYPQIQLVATTPVTSRPMDVLDNHYYNSPGWFVDNAHLFDTAPRTGPRILAGEYAALQGTPTGTLAAAVGEAAFITGMERNADLVLGASYAPILVNVNAPTWPTNLIGYDALSSFGSPSYYVQRLLGTQRGDTVVRSQFQGSNGQLASVVSRDARTGALFVTVVNPSDTLQLMRVSVSGAGRIAGRGTATVLSGDVAAQNTLADPVHVAPVTAEVGGLGTSFAYQFPAHSVTVLRLGSQSGE
jgi:alpha-L-arabinofuranosidase